MRQQDFISEYRGAVTSALKAIEKLQNLHQEALLIGYPESFSEEIAFSGENAQITSGELKEAMSSAASVLGDITQIELASLYKVRN